LGVDHQYIFLRMLEDVQSHLERESKLTSELLKVLTPPAGMIPSSR
jgi:hypothetical protein